MSDAAPSPAAAASVDERDASTSSSHRTTSNALGPVCLSRPGVSLGGHPKWYPPTGSYRTGLRVHNTLTGDAPVEFVPSVGRKVLWYTCGPTVYDSAHMGHARAYLTFDILRRIMEDYFRYDVTYQVNVTDIDDKIILRARRNKLLEDYEREISELNDPEEAFRRVSSIAEEALEAKSTALESKLDKASAPLSDGANSRDVAARDTQIKETKLKMSQLSSTRAKVDAVRAVEKDGIEAKLIELGKEANALGWNGVVAAGERDDDASVLLEALEKMGSALDDEIELKRSSGGDDDEGGLLQLEERRRSLGLLVAKAEAIATCVSKESEGGDDAVPLWKALLTASKDEAGELLDDRRGSTVTDRSVFDGHARRYEREFMEDMEMLGVHEPDVLTRVTEYVPQIVTFIEGIVDKGLAYESNGSVYLSIDDFKDAGHDYRKLLPGKGDTTEAEMAEGEGALGSSADDKEKRSVNDFALWKASKPGEPEWDSPWGKGRPGWHIECSVVASDILGQNMDVHAGGNDLKFPHHDNELAQSEARFGCSQWVNYFFHAGHLHIKGLKMSKSLKNFITVRQALKEHTARQLRLMFLLQPWDRPMNYSDQTVGDAKAKEAMFNNFFGDVKALLRTDWLSDETGFRNPEDDRNLMRAIHETQTKVHESLCDNFDTPSAVLALCDLVSTVNKYLRRPNPKPHVVLVRKAARYVSTILRVFGVVPGSDDLGFRSGGGGGGGASGDGADRETTIKPFVQSLIDFRDRVRKAARTDADKKEFLDACDDVRDESLTKLGVRLEDKEDVTIWKLDDPETLRKELAARREAEAQRKAAKAAKRRAALLKDIEKWEAARTPPVDRFRTGPDASKYSAFDDDGVPTRDAEGKEINKSGRKKLQKQIKAQEKVHGQLLEKSGGDVDGFLARLREELEGL